MADLLGVYQLLSEGWLAALAATGGTTLVAAATTDAWSTARAEFVRLLSRGDRRDGDSVSDELDTLADSVREGPESASELESLRADWTVRLCEFLEEYPEAATDLDGVVHRLAGLSPSPQEGGTQTNIAYGRGTQNITQHGSIHINITDHERGGRGD
ncbi:hypothetical protein [Streptomyces sp. 6N223]|uniref:hypothetical protein n=1 Tax=Streptomyces sp. 6N223 TaxID=3457412 RepID=UPI003FD45D14